MKKTRLKLNDDDLQSAVEWFRGREIRTRHGAALRRLWKAAKFEGNLAVIPVGVFMQEMKQCNVVK